VYWPLSAKKEVDIRPLIRTLYAQNVAIYLPVMSGDELMHGLYAGDEDLAIGLFGVAEPRPDPTFDIEALDCIIVPTLAVDLAGNRIGYGKGYYDRFLKQTNAIKIAPIFANQLVQWIPTETHDVPVDILVTEQYIYNAVRL